MANFPVTDYNLIGNPYDQYSGDQLNFFDPWRDYETVPANTIVVPNTFRWINEPRRVVHHRQAASSSYYKTTNNFATSNGTLPSIPPMPSMPPMQPILPVPPMLPIPTLSNPLLPVQSEKFRVQLNVAGFTPETIRTRIEGRKVIVEGKQEEREVNGDYSNREIRKTYDLPEHADANNLVSFVTPNNMLVIEVPVNRPGFGKFPTPSLPDAKSLALFGAFRDPIFDYMAFMGSEFSPRVIDLSDGQKQIKLSLSVQNYRPEQIKVSIKNNELIVQAEHVYNDNNRAERSFLTKSILLPPGTQTEQITSFLNPEGQLEINAPYIEPSQVRSIEVQHT